MHVGYMSAAMSVKTWEQTIKSHQVCPHVGRGVHAISPCSTCCPIQNLAVMYNLCLWCFGTAKDQRMLLVTQSEGHKVILKNCVDPAAEVQRRPQRAAVRAAADN